METNKNIQDFINLISNIFDTFTTAYFIFDKSYNNLYLKYYSSLSNNLDKNAIINIGQHLKVFLRNYSKPIEITNEKDLKEIELLKIYKKPENIKTFFIIPCNNYTSAIYIDSKKSYSFPERQQKLLYYCSSLLEKLINIEQEQETIKETLNILEIAKRIKIKISKEISFEKILNILCYELSADFSTLIVNQNSYYRIISTNFEELKYTKKIKFNYNNNIVGTLLKNNLKNIKFTKIENEETPVISENFQFTTIKIENFLYVPFIKENKIYALLLFFNIEKEINFQKFFYFMYDILSQIIFEIVIKEQIDNFIKYEPFSGFLRDIEFLNYLNNISASNRKGIICFKVKNISQLLKKITIINLLSIYKQLKQNIESFLEEKTTAGLFSFSTVGFIYTESHLKKLEPKKQLILKSFTNKIFIINNIEITVDFSIKIFPDLIKQKDSIFNFAY